MSATSEILEPQQASTAIPAAALVANGLTVRFGGHVAANDVGLEVKPGRVTGLIGPNGAGKTTTFNALCGLQSLAGGTVMIAGVDATNLSPHKRARLGVGRTFQRLEIFSLLTVRENILAGAEFASTKGRGDDQSPSEVTDSLIRRLGLEGVADQRVDRLSTGKARLVEVARALANRPSVLLLDEPSSGLDETESESFGELLKELARTANLAILMVEHDMALVMSTCAEIYVLDFGQIIAHGTPEEIRSNPTVMAAYLGAETDDEQTDLKANKPINRASQLTARQATSEHVASPLPTPILETHGLSAGYGGIDAITGIDLQLHPGEVLALLGSNGAGKSTLMRAITGLIQPTKGSLMFCGHRVNGATADQLTRAGVCMVPEGRGVFPNLSVRENLWMATHAGKSRSDVEAVAFDRFPRLAERKNQLAGTMSGGEQQMLAMARALANDPTVLVLDELSMGLAPIIVSTLYEQVAEIARSGTSILVVEQFAHEILGFADRAAIMLHGKIVETGDPHVIASQLAEAYLSGNIDH